MFDLIEKLRAKPDSTKKQIAFLVALSVAGIIFVIWLSVIYPDWKEGEIKESNVAKIEPSPLSGFTSNFSNGLTSIKEQFSKLKESVSSFSNSPEYYRAETIGTSTPNLTQ